MFNYVSSVIFMMYKVEVELNQLKSNVERWCASVKKSSGVKKSCWHLHCGVNFFIGYMSRQKYVNVYVLHYIYCNANDARFYTIQKRNWQYMTLMKISLKKKWYPIYLTSSFWSFVRMFLSRLNINNAHDVHVKNRLKVVFEKSIVCKECCVL